MAELTKEQIFKYKKELEYFYKQRKKLLIISFVLFGIVFLSIIGTIIVVTTTIEFIWSIMFIYPMIFAFIGAIVVLILRSALYNTRINNRLIALEYNKSVEDDNKKE